MLFQSLLIAGIAQTIFVIVLLRTAKKSSANLLLTIWLSILSLQLLFFYDNLSAKPMAPTWLALMGFALPVLSTPFLYLYFSALSQKAQIIWPHLICYPVYVLMLLFLPVEQVVGGYPHFAPGMPVWFADSILYVLAIVPAVYMVLSVKVLWKTSRTLATSFAMLFTALFTMIRFGALFYPVGAGLSAYVFFIGYRALRPAPKPRYARSGLTDDTISGIYGKLTLHMQNQHPYLADDLSLDDLSKQLHIPAHQLSQAINHSAGVNFFAFVNAYRIQAVQARLADPRYSAFSLLGIAYDCGFRSKSTFNKVFKQITGETPSAYQKKMSVPAG